MSRRSRFLIAVLHLGRVLFSAVHCLLFRELTGTEARRDAATTRVSNMKCSWRFFSPKWYTSKKARRAGRKANKTKAWMKDGAAERRRKEHVATHQHKHRQGVRNARVLVGIANGRVRLFEYYDGRFTAETYQAFVHGFIDEILTELKQENGGKPVYLMRDGDPKSHHTKIGLAAEAGYISEWGVIAQSSCTPEANVEDHSFWSALNRAMEQHVVQWEAANEGELFEEDFETCKRRARRTARGMTEECIHGMTGHTRKQLDKIREADGWYVSG